jgi:hypothetical protein
MNNVSVVVVNSAVVALAPGFLAEPFDCQMAYFQTKSLNLGKFLKFLQWKMLVYFVAIWYIPWPFVVFYVHLVYYVANGIFCGHSAQYFPLFGMLYQEKIWQP